MINMKICENKNCNKKATKNYQIISVVWEINKNGDYSEAPEYTGDYCEDNVFYCDKCYNKFREGKIN